MADRAAIDFHPRYYDFTPPYAFDAAAIALLLPQAADTPIILRRAARRHAAAATATLFAASAIFAQLQIVRI